MQKFAPFPATPGAGHETPSHSVSWTFIFRTSPPSSTLQSTPLSGPELVHILLQGEVSKHEGDRPRPGTKRAGGYYQNHPMRQFLQLLRVITLTSSRRKLARQITLPSAPHYEIQKMYTVSKKSKPSIPKKALRAARSGHS